MFPAMRARGRYREEALALVESETLAKPAFVFAPANLDVSPGETLSAGGERFYAPKLLPQSDELTTLACGLDFPPVRWSRCDECSSRASCKIDLPRSSGPVGMLVQGWSWRQRERAWRS